MRSPAFGFLEGFNENFEQELFSSKLNELSIQFFNDKLKESLYTAHWYFLRNEWGYCFKQLDELILFHGKESKDDNRNKDLCEAIFLREVVSDRLGKSLLDRIYFDEIYPRLIGLGKLDIHFAFKTEAAGLMMARGFYKAAQVHLSEAEEMKCSKPWYWLFRASVISGICSQALGHYEESEKALSSQAKFLEKHTTGSLYLALQRRKLSLLIESERYGEVERHIEQNETSMFLCNDNLVKAMWLKEIARYRTTVISPIRVRGFWEEFELTIKKAGVSDDNLRPTEERCEIAILQNNLVEAQQIIDLALIDAQRIGIPSAECVCLFAKARVLCHLRQFESATEIAFLALRIAQVYGYCREQVRILFLLYSLFKHQSNKKESQRIFSEICSHPTLTHLQYHHSFMRYVCAIFEKGYNSISEYLKIEINDNFSRNVFENWMVSYAYSNLQHQIYKFIFFSDYTEKTSHEISTLPSIIENTRSQQKVCYFVDQCCFLDARSKETPKLISLHLEQKAQMLLHIISKKAGNGIKLQDIHNFLWPNVIWTPDRHAQACYHLISECRTICKKMNFTIILNKKNNTYHVRASDTALFLASNFHTRARSRTSLKSNIREQQILDELHKRGKASGASLAAFIKIARQTLHPLLKKMEKEKKIVQNGVGRNAFYMVFEK